MDENKNEEAEVEETLDLPEVEEGQEDTTDWKAEAQKLREKAIAQRERTKSIKQRAKDAEAKVAELSKTSPQTPAATKTGELDETALDYLDLKGITEAEDIKVIETIVKKTGMTVREALKDEFVSAKLRANLEKREVKDATPGATKRSGSTGDTLERAVAKYEQSGYKDLPEDFELRAKVVNAVEKKSNPNKPSWRS
jgi:hypothetical protein